MDGEADSRERPALACAAKIGVSDVWKGAMSHSDSEKPWVGPEV